LSHQGIKKLGEFQKIVLSCTQNENISSLRKMHLQCCTEEEPKKQSGFEA
jgi:hypothetical protein